MPYPLGHRGDGSPTEIDHHILCHHKYLLSINGNFFRTENTLDISKLLKTILISTRFLLFN